MPEDTLLLSLKDVARCIEMKEVVEIVGRVFKAHGENEVILPPKICLDLEPMGYRFWHNAMPAYVKPFDAAGIKWAGGLDNNPSKHGLPFIMGMIMLQDPDSGVILSVMDGAWITALRTGAAGAVCASLTMVRNATTVAIVGAGVQGRTTLSALSHVMRIGEVRVADVIPEARERYAREMGAELGIKVRACGTVQEAVEGADVVVTATASRVPIVKSAWLKPGVACVSLGSYQEFDDEFDLGADRIFVDNFEQCSHRGEIAPFFHDGRMKPESVAGNIGEVAAGLKLGRGSDSERTLVVPLGVGSHDIAVASVVYKRAKEMGLGARFNFL